MGGHLVEGNWRKKGAREVAKGGGPAHVRNCSHRLSNIYGTPVLRAVALAARMAIGPQSCTGFPSSVVPGRQTSMDNFYPPEPRNAAPAMACEGCRRQDMATRRQHDRLRRRNHTPMAACSLAMMAAAVQPLESMHGGPSDFEKLPRRQNCSSHHIDIVAASVCCDAMVSWRAPSDKARASARQRGCNFTRSRRSHKRCPHTNEWATTKGPSTIPTQARFPIFGRGGV